MILLPAAQLVLDFHALPLLDVLAAELLGGLEGAGDAQGVRQKHIQLFWVDSRVELKDPLLDALLWGEKRRLGFV